MLTPKVIACLAVVLSTNLARLEASAETINPNDTMQALRTADTDYTKADEDRMNVVPPVARTASVFQELARYRAYQKFQRPLLAHMLYPFDVPALPIIPHPKVNFADTQSAKRVYYKWKSDEEMMSIICELILKGSDTRGIYTSMKGPNDNFKLGVKDRISAGIHKWLVAFRDHSRNNVPTWWKEGKSLADVQELAEAHPNDPYIYYSSITFSNMYNNRGDVLRDLFQQWLQDGARPDDASKKLVAQFPGEGKMTVNFVEEYKRLYSIHQETIEIMKQSLEKKQSWAAISASLLPLHSKDTIVFRDMLEYYEDLYTITNYSVGRREAWKQRRISPDDLRRVLGFDHLRGSAITAHYDYPEYLMYRRWYDFCLREEMTKWLKEGKNPDDVRGMLYLDGLEGSALTEHYNYPFCVQYLDWWIDAYPERALGKWMQEDKTPAAVFALMKLHLVEDEMDKKISYYVRYFDWWLDTHDQEALETWLREAGQPYFVKYNKWRAKVGTMNVLQKWLQDKKEPGEVTALLTDHDHESLGLFEAKSSEYYKEAYLEMWNKAYPQYNSAHRDQASTSKT